MSMTTEQLYDTSDMGLAIALICLGHELVQLEQAGSSKRVTFRFKAANGLYEAAQSYWCGKLYVDAKAYWNESKNLKTRLYSLQ